VLIIRRINYINTTIQHLVYVKSPCTVHRPVCRSGSSYPTCIPDGHLHRVTYTGCFIDTVDSPDDEHKVAGNMQRIGINICKRNCASSWLFVRTCSAVNVARRLGQNLKWLRAILNSEHKMKTD
jgi:hypothetical protein